MSARPALAVQLYSFRDQIAEDPARVISRVAEMGFIGVEVLSMIGLAPAVREVVAPWTVEARSLKRLLDESGLVVCSAHTGLPEGEHFELLLEEQNLLGNDLVIVSSLNALPNAATNDLETLEALKRTADRFNAASSLAAAHGIRVGYHNHFSEWNGSIDGRPAWDVFWDHLDRSVVAEVDIYWAQVAGCDPGEIIADLGPRAQLVHVKDGPLIVDEPMMAVGTGKAAIAPALGAGEHVRWHIVEIDESAADIFEAVEQSACWLVDRGFSSNRWHAPGSGLAPCWETSASEDVPEGA